MATHVDLRRMLANDQRLTTVFLTFGSRLDNDDFRRAIAINTAVQEVVFSADDSFFQECPEDRFQDVLEGLSRLPRLRKISINSFPNCRGVVSMKAIHLLVQGAKSLDTLSISDIELAGNAQDFASFAAQIQQMLYLRSFCMVGCNIFRPLARPSSPLPLLSSSSEKLPKVEDVALLDQLFTSLSILPSLQVVYVEAKDQGGLGDLSVPSATSLFLSASIRFMRIRNLDLSDDHIACMASMLEMNHTLQALDVGSMTDFKAPAAQAMGKMLRVNTTLLHLELGMDKILQDECAEILAEALQHNRQLRSFALVARNPMVLKQQRLSPKTRKAMLQMLQQNYQLQKFFLFRKYSLNREFKLYSSLNKLGRGSLLQDANRPEDWIQKLATVNNNLDSIFYFVSNNPTLCMQPLAAPKRKSSNSDFGPPASKKQRISTI